MKNKLLLIIIVLFVNSSIYSQNNKSEFLYYNIGLGGFVGGLGAVINKKPDEKFGKVFLKGFSQGALGGGLVYVSKNIVGEIAVKQDYKYSWYGKFTNSFGNSIIENATLNRNFYDQFNFNFGFNRIEVYPANKFKVKYKLMPVSFILSLYVASQSKFEVEKTIATGELVFSSSKFDSRYRGLTIGNAVVLNSDFVQNKNTISHEFIHIYQYNDYNFVNTFLDKPINRLFKNSKFYVKTKRFLYYDLQAPILHGLYLLSNGTNYYDNFYEREAGTFSNTLF